MHPGDFRTAGLRLVSTCLSVQVIVQASDQPFDSESVKEVIDGEAGEV